MIKSFSNVTNGVNSEASTTTENKSLNSPTMATPNQELNLSDLMTQINLAQLAMIEKTSATSTINTSGSITSNSFNANCLNFLNNQNSENTNSFSTNELNNNNPLAINFNINENVNNSQLMNESSLLSQNLINNSFPNSNLSIINSRNSPFNNSNSIPSNSRPKPRLVQLKYKFGRLGHGNGQLSSPHGFCLGVDEEVIIADTFNHRICIFDKTGQFKHQFGNQGKEEGQLWYPRKVALIQTPNVVSSITSPRFVVCDRGSERSRMQIFSRTGNFLSRIVICYIDIVAGLAITPEGNIVAVDSVKASLFVILESGELLKWFEFGDQMQEPSDIAVYENLYYICDFKGHCVVVFNNEGEFVRRIGNPKVPNYPNGIDIADNGNILIGDSHGNKFHIVVYDKNGKPIKEFECLNAKVSRCCGLRITKEGYIVTLAKNNHHVLVLDALYYDNNSSSILSCSKANNSVSLYNNSLMSKEDLDLNDYMTQYNLTLLALYDSTNSNSSNQNLSSGFNNKPLANINNNNNITPNNNLSSTSLMSNVENSLSSSFAKPSILDNSFSGFNSSLLGVEQQLQDFSFDESTINSFNMSKSFLEKNDLARASRDVNSIVSSLASPTQPDSQVTTPVSKTRKSAMLIKHKFGHLGSLKGQFASPHGFCLGVDEEIVIADTYNHRICVFNKQGEFLHQFGNQGKEEGQLWHPRKVAVTRVPAGVISAQPKFVVCDRGNEKSRMQLFSKNGNFIRKINIRYIDIVAGLAITPTNNIVAVDSVMPTVYIISEAGDLTKWFDCSKHMCEPSDIAINGDLYYICDFKGHCVVVFNEDGQFLRTIGNKILTKFPNGIDISDYGDVLVGDSHGNRFHVVVFDKNGKILSEFECPYAKVSRCCGLKLTSEGYVVTLAKNNHHVLILDTLYVI